MLGWVGLVVGCVCCVGSDWVRCVLLLGVLVWCWCDVVWNLCGFLNVFAVVVCFCLLFVFVCVVFVFCVCGVGVGFVLF